MKILSVDYGTRRTGFAVCDDGCKTAVAHHVYKMNGNYKTDIKNIAEIIKKSLCAKVVVGKPVKMDGTHSSQTEKILKFARDLGKLIGMEIIVWDEGATSVEAEFLLRSSGMNRRDKRVKNNSVAAQLILQSYIDNNPC